MVTQVPSLANPTAASRPMPTLDPKARSGARSRKFRNVFSRIKVANFRPGPPGLRPVFFLRHIKIVHKLFALSELVEFAPTSANVPKTRLALR